MWKPTGKSAQMLLKQKQESEKIEKEAQTKGATRHSDNGASSGHVSAATATTTTSATRTVTVASPLYFEACFVLSKMRTMRSLKKAIEVYVSKVGDVGAAALLVEGINEDEIVDDDESDEEKDDESDRPMKSHRQRPDDHDNLDDADCNRARDDEQVDTVASRPSPLDGWLMRVAGMSKTMQTTGSGSGVTEYHYDHHPHRHQHHGVEDADVDQEEDDMHSSLSRKRREQNNKGPFSFLFQSHRQERVTEDDDNDNDDADDVNDGDDHDDGDVHHHHSEGNKRRRLWSTLVRLAKADSSR